MTLAFVPIFAKYYEKWYRDCWDSAVYCTSKGDFNKAHEYITHMQAYWNIILNHWDDIQFYKIGDNAFLTEWATQKRRTEWEASQVGE